ncbi:hypothetical protein HDU96_002717 [Phlyctochytrium bullatum]|nr:hypothetical protein HDU96_002717 [Phlyctochytrium bullatum]
MMNAKSFLDCLTSKCNNEDTNLLVTKVDDIERFCTNFSPATIPATNVSATATGTDTLSTSDASATDSMASLTTRPAAGTTTYEVPTTRAITQGTLKTTGTGRRTIYVTQGPTTTSVQSGAIGGVKLREPAVLVAGLAGLLVVL